jgi:hypothetical protein
MYGAKDEISGVVKEITLKKKSGVGEGNYFYFLESHI